MNTENSSLDLLSGVLYKGRVKACDIKTMPGVDPNATSEVLAHALFSSMQRVGIVKGDVLVDKNS
jgi:hypothetical protein